MKQHGRVRGGWILAATLLVAAGALRLQSQPQSGPAVITLNPARHFQTITGWEATAQAGQEQIALFQQYRNRLFDLAVRDLGINRLRVYVKSGTENPIDYFTRCLRQGCSEAERKNNQYRIVNDNNDPNRINPAGFHFSELDFEMEQVVLPIRRRLSEAGERLYINLNYVDFRASAFEHKNRPAEYAEFVLATYRHLQSRYNVVPDSWEVILEPDAAAWSAQQVAAAIAAAGKRLKDAGFTPRFTAPSTTSMANAVTYFDAIASRPDALPFLREISYHRYSGVSIQALRQIADRARQYGRRTAMLEHIGSDYQTLHQDLKTGNNSAWQQYTLAYPGEPDNGSSYYVIRTNASGQPIVSMGSRTGFLRQYFRYIRRGARRIEAVGSDPALDPLAFVNRNGRYVVVVKASRSKTFRVRNLPAGTYEITFTTRSRTGVRLPDRTVPAGGVLQASMPSAGVITIAGRN